MTESARCQNVVDFEKSLQERESRGSSPLARYARDNCVEASERSEWNTFGYWFAIFRRERQQFTQTLLKKNCRGS